MPPPAAPPALHALRAPRCIMASSPRAASRRAPPAPPPLAPRRDTFQPRAPTRRWPAPRTLRPALPRARAQRRPSAAAAAAGGPGGAPGPSDGSAFADSEVVRSEAAAIFADFGELSRLQPKYFSFDLAGKRIFIAKIEAFLEALKIFTLRYELSDDPFARECMRQLNAKMLEAGMSRRGLMEQFQAMVQLMRAELDREEMRGVAPAPPGAQQHRMPDMAALMLDPDISEAMDDPKVIAIVQQCAAQPALVANYAAQPKLYKLLKALFGDPGAPQQGGG